MTAMLKGRFGYYTPRTPEERLRARKREAKRKQQLAEAEAWRERNRWCRNGCGQPAAFYKGNITLRFSGCCSSVCEEAFNAREAAAWEDKETEKQQEAVPSDDLPRKIERHCPRCHHHAYHWLTANGEPSAIKGTKRHTATCVHCGHSWPCRVMQRDK